MAQLKGLTSPVKLDELAERLEREAGRIEATRAGLAQDVEATRGAWEGRVAESFRRHTGRSYRQHHLEVAHDRLRRAAKLARAAAEENRAAMNQAAAS